MFALAMDKYTTVGVLSPESDSMSPLPPDLRTGLPPLVLLASLSLTSSTLLLIHLTCKLFRYSIKRRKSKKARKAREAARQSMDLSLGLDPTYFGARQSIPGSFKSGREVETIRCPPPNQFVILLYNLLLADMHQAVAFFLNVVWVANDGIFVNTRVCWTQGWFISSGDLSSSCFIFAIALHTYLTVVKEYKPSEWAFNLAIIGMWIFVYGISIVGIAGTNNGMGSGGYFVRAAAWCWINEEFETLRLLSHYLYIFMSIILTSVLYMLVFLNIRSRILPPRLQSRKYTNSLKRTYSADSSITQQSVSPEPPAQLNAGHHPAFLIYPIIYVFCTLPLALGRIATMAGSDVPLGYFCAAGALIVSNGWLDVLLWGTTRRTLVFGPVDNADALGLDTFNFMRTPPQREFGNMVWVQGAATTDASSHVEKHAGGAGQRISSNDRPSLWGRVLDVTEGKNTGGRPGATAGSRGRGSRYLDRGRYYHRERYSPDHYCSSSQETLRPPDCFDLGNHIHMDTVTSVTVVEIDKTEFDAHRRPRSEYTTGGTDSELGFGD